MVKMTVSGHYKFVMEPLEDFAETYGVAATRTPTGDYEVVAGDADTLESIAEEITLDDPRSTLDMTDTIVDVP